MRRFIATLVAVGTICTGLFVAATPAQAGWEWKGNTTISQTADKIPCDRAAGKMCRAVGPITDHVSLSAQPQGWEWGASTPDTAQVTLAPWRIYSGHKWTVHLTPGVPALCIANGILNEPYYPVIAAATAWNNAGSGSVPINVRNRCDGFGNGTRATIETYQQLDGKCVRMTDASWTSSPNNSTLGFRVWTVNPIVWIQVNTAYNCNSTAIRRAHWVSVAIGLLLGLRQISEDGLENRVMHNDSQDIMRYPSGSTDGDAVRRLYNGDFVGACYTAGSTLPCGSGIYFYNTGMV